MPTNMMYADSMFPRLRENEDPAESIKRTNNYLYMLLEQLRYSFHNLELANFNAAALDRWEGIITDPIYVSLKGLDGKATELALTAEGLCLDIYGKDGSTGIKATVEGLYVDVNGENGKFTKLSTTVNGLSLDINGDGDKNLGLKATVDGLSIDINGENGKFSSLKQTVDGLDLTIHGDGDKNLGLKATVNGLYLDVNGEEGKFTKLSTTVNGLGVQINGPDGKTGINATVNGLFADINGKDGSVGLKATVGGLSTQVYGKEGESTLYSTVQQSAEKINFAVADKDSEGKFTLTPEMASLVAGKIDLTGYVTFSSLTEAGQSAINGANITTGTLSADKITSGTLDASKVTVKNLSASSIISGTLDASKVTVSNLSASSITSGTLDASKVTVSNLDATNITTGKLDGKFLKAGTVTASTIKGNVVQLLTGDGYLAGELMLTASSSSLTGGSALNIRSGAVAMYSEVGDVFIKSYNQTQNNNFSSLLLTLGGIYTRGHLVPSNDKAYDLGFATCVYRTAYIANGVVSLSDRREKRDIDYDLTRYDALFDNLAPCSFRFVDGDRVHIGMISQDVEERMAQCGIDSMELAAFIKSPNEDGGYRYGLRYSEFISLLIDQVQKLKKRVKDLEEAA